MISSPMQGVPKKNEIGRWCQYFQLNAIYKNNRTELISSVCGLFRPLSFCTCCSDECWGANRQTERNINRNLIRNTERKIIKSHPQRKREALREIKKEAERATN